MKARRNASVELMRLFGILMILGYHNIQADLMLDVSYDFFTNFWTCFYSDCVPMFFMIAGFFLFHEKNSYPKVLRHLFRGIILPTLLLLLCYFYLYDWLIHGIGLYQSLHKSPGEYYAFFRSLLTLQSPWPYTNHTWYLFLYTMVMLCYPAMKGLVDYLDRDIRREKYFLIGSLALFVLNDIFSNAMLDFSYHSIGGAVPAFIMVIWGHILYRHRDKITRGRGAAVAAQAALILNNLLRDRIVYLLFLKDGSLNTHIKNWYASFGLINPFLMMIIAFNITRGEQDTRINRAIVAAASVNLPVYLLHQICIDWITASGLRRYTADAIAARIPFLPLADLSSVLLHTMMTAVLTLLLVILVRFIAGMTVHYGTRRVTKMK